jgi:ankyrin repeat protein
MADSDSASDNGDADPRHELLYSALEGGDDATALSIVRGGVDVNGVWDEVAHLVMASACGRVGVVSSLLELGADVNKTTPSYKTPLEVAASNGHQEVIELLVEVGNAQLDKQDHTGYTAFHNTAYSNQLEPAKYLVARGCSLTVQDSDGETALDLATLCNHPPLVKFLTSAAQLTTANDYIGLRSLCAPYSSPYLSLNSARSLRYTIILAVHRARRIIDAPNNTTPILTFLRRLALLPSADNSSPNTESQVFRRVLSYVGTGFNFASRKTQRRAHARARQKARIKADFWEAASSSSR